LSVNIHKLTIRYGSVTAVELLSLNFPPGSTGLLGENGAGKTSLIKGLLGLVPIESGSASILGHDITKEGKSIRQLIGYMPEDNCLIPGLTGLEMVRYAGELCGMRYKDAMQRAHEVLCAVGLEESRYRRVETYSSGMKQRIKLAQAIVHDPRLLFLDEPTTGMDPKGRQEMLDMILEISMIGGKSVVFASHILVDVERICERVVILHQGKAAKQAKIEDLRKSYMNIYTVRVDGDQDLFVKTLENRGCIVKFEGKHLMDVTLPVDGKTEVIVKTARDTNVLLRKVVPSIQTLEDVFIKRIAGDRNADL
jgi:ABC-2 type transport system ATP-binding protein